MSWLENEQLSEVQMWGHGSAGRALIGADVFDAEYVRSSSLFKRWAALRPFQQHPSPLIWFRTCYTMKGEVGRTFATLLAHELGCRVAGYTQYIHVVQRGLVVAWPDRPPRWSDEAAAGARVWFCTFSPVSLAPLWGCTGAEVAGEYSRRLTWTMASFVSLLTCTLRTNLRAVPANVAHHPSYISCSQPSPMYSPLSYDHA